MDEVWKPITDLLPYEISNKGNIRNGKTFSIITNKRTKIEKAKIVFRFNTKQRFFKIYRDEKYIIINILDLMDKYYW